MTSVLTRLDQSTPTNGGTSAKWFREQFLRLAHELDAAREQELKPRHLMIRASRAKIQAARLVLEGVNAGIFSERLKLRAMLRSMWTGHLEGRAGSISIDQEGRCHAQLVASTPEDDGAPLPVESATHEQLAGLWVFPIFPILKSTAPSSFKADAGAYDWKTDKKDEHGRLLGKDGKPLVYVRETVTDPDTGEELVSWRLSGEPAYVGENYDQADWLAHHRVRAGDWANACSALADLV